MVLKLLIFSFIAIGIAWPACLFADVRVSGFSPFNFSTYSGSGALSSDINLCIYSESGTYVVSARGGSGPFVLHDGSRTLAYTAYWNDSASTSGNVMFPTANSSLSNRGNADTTDPDCDGGKNANLQLIISEQALRSARAGSYSGSIVIVVEPN